MLRVGLTGGIASGKSHVAVRLAQSGFLTLDLDRVGHQALARDGAAYADVVAAFGPRVLDAAGNVDRKALGRLVFADPEARARLNALVHPRIRAEESRLLARGDAPVAVIEAALVIETGQHLRFDRLVVAHCGAAEQLRRLMNRDGLDEAAAAARLRAQMPADDKRRFAHHVVDTAGSTEETNREADRLAAELRALSHGQARRLDLERAAALAFGGRSVGPGGLTADALVEEMAAGLDLDRLSRRLSPPPSPWYEPGDEDAQEAEAWAGPVALYGMVRRGDDPEYTAGVAFSMARLTHTSAPALSRAVLFALAAQAAALGARDPVSGTARALAERFGGSAPMPEACRAAAAEALALAASSPSLAPARRAALERLIREGGR
ncbi:MAG TPA: dephospho-CoA kinase [Vicinamibacteria bacterium]|nr:dephospho-CoA kinase [Vicinamibacteria bacterium]